MEVSPPRKHHALGSTTKKISSDIFALGPVFLADARSATTNHNLLNAKKRSGIASGQNSAAARDLRPKARVPEPLARGVQGGVE
jgi:hypothetical protein